MSVPNRSWGDYIEKRGYVKEDDKCTVTTKLIFNDMEGGTGGFTPKSLQDHHNLAYSVFYFGTVPYCTEQYVWVLVGMPSGSFQKLQNWKSSSLFSGEAGFSGTKLKFPPIDGSPS